jgi:acyl-CoA thioesterase
VTQREGKGICFTCICSFKTAEHEQFDAQEKLDLCKKYSSVLDGKKPSDFPEVPGMDLPFYRKRRDETGINDQFPGLECRKVDMAAYNKDRHPLDRRQLIFFRTIGDLPDDDNMHLCAHLYASDRNSLYIVANHFELADHYTGMGSLAHTFIFHSPMRSMLLGSAGLKVGSSASHLYDRDGRWFCMEISGNRLGGGRAVHNCRIWNSEGEHVATSMQDGMVRMAANPQKPTDEELKFLESTSRRWNSVKRDEKL